jgi:hypothetical protein
MPVITSFSLDLTQSPPLEYIFAKQRDANSRTLEIILTNSGAAYTIPSSTTPRLRMTKKDGTQVYNDGTVQNNKVYVDMTDQMLAVPGIAVADIQLIGASGLVLSSQLFYLNIEEYASSEEGAVSTDEYTALTNALVRLEQTEAITAAAETATQETLTAKAATETATSAAIAAKDLTVAATTAANNAIASIENMGIVKYSVQFSGSSPTGTRLDAAVGHVANVAVDAATVVNDFDSVSFFNRPICCCTWNTALRKWRVNAYRGEPGFAWDGSNGEVMYECKPFYYKINADLTYVSVTATPCEGYALAPMFPDGNTKVYCPVFWLSMVNNVAASRSGTHPTPGSLNGHMTNARTFDSKAHLETIKVRFSEYLLQLVEFATRDVQTVLMGACNMTYNGTTDVIASVISDTSFTTTSTVGARFVAGQTISIGSAQNGEQRTSHVVITSITTLDTVSTFVLDTAVAGLAVGDFLSSRAWINGATNVVTASSGSPVSNTDGKHPCIWRGKVDPWADAFSSICDLLIKREGAGTTESPYTYTPYFLNDPTLYNAGAITADYIKANFTIPGADGYVMTIGKDSRYPFVFLTTVIGASSTTYAAAYYYYPRYDVCAVRVGGYWDIGRLCSPVYFSCYYAPSDSFILYLARLFVSP